MTEELDNLMKLYALSGFPGALTKDKCDQLVTLMEKINAKLEKHDNFERCYGFDRVEQGIEKLEMEKAILGSFKDDAEAFFTMNDVKDFEDCDKQFNNLKQVIEKIKLFAVNIDNTELDAYLADLEKND